MTISFVLTILFHFNILLKRCKSIKIIWYNQRFSHLFCFVHQKVPHLEGLSSNYSKLFRVVYKGSLADAEVTICKYKWLIINVYAFVLGCLKWLRGTVEGRKIGKNLQIWLPSKKENANICKIDFPVLCTFTLFNADFCTFLQSLWSEQGMSLVCPLVMLIVISNPFYSNGTWWHFIVPFKMNTLLSLGDKFE